MSKPLIPDKKYKLVHHGSVYVGLYFRTPAENLGVFSIQHILSGSAPEFGIENCIPVRYFESITPYVPDPPELPRVQLAELLDRKWYAARYREDHGGEVTLVKVSIETDRTNMETFELEVCDPYPVFWVTGNDYHTDAELFTEFWGPLEWRLEGVESGKEQSDDGSRSGSDRPNGVDDSG